MSNTFPRRSPDQGVRVLSLGELVFLFLIVISDSHTGRQDGGGTGALSELLILERMMFRAKTEGLLDTVPSPCECFDIIGGSGMGR